MSVYKTASVGFWRSTAKTDASFIDIAQYVARIAGTPQTFVDGLAAKTWLNANGYWTSYPATVIIGSQIWTSQNLDVTTYQNGDPIPEVTDATAWAALTTGAWCYYNNDPANGAIYGKLYNWYAVNDPRGLAPLGFHIPTNTEWATLSTYLGGDSAAGGKMKTTGTSIWQSPNSGATNDSGFSGLPGGFRNVSAGFANIGLVNILQSSTELNSTNAYFRLLYYDLSILGNSSDIKTCGFSVRCIKD